MKILLKFKNGNSIKTFGDDKASVHVCKLSVLEGEGFKDYPETRLRNTNVVEDGHTIFQEE